MSEHDVTRLLSAWRIGDTDARDRIIAILYPELRRLARQAFRREAPGHTLQPTALVNEAWLKLACGAVPDAVDRQHLLAMSARLMREILVDHARRSRAAKRDGGQRTTLSSLDAEPDDRTAAAIDVLALDRALGRLHLFDATKARVVELRYFGGLSIEETGDVLGQSPATVKRHWQTARIWLHDSINGGQGD